MLWVEKRQKFSTKKGPDGEKPEKERESRGERRKKEAIPLFFSQKREKRRNAPTGSIKLPLLWRKAIG